MHIDTFIDQYTPLEVDKIHRKDATSKFDNTIRVQKIANRAKSRKETSPIRGKRRAADENRSPERNIRPFEYIWNNILN